MAKKSRGGAGTAIVRSLARRVNVWVGTEHGLSQGYLICPCGIEMPVADAQIVMGLSGTPAVGGRQFACDSALPEAEASGAGDTGTDETGAGNGSAENTAAGDTGTSEGEQTP